MKTAIDFDSGKDLITFTLQGENASEIALLGVLKAKQPKIELIEWRKYETAPSYPCVQFSIALKESAPVVASSGGGGIVIEGVSAVIK